MQPEQLLLRDATVATPPPGLLCPVLSSAAVLLVLLPVLPVLLLVLPVLSSVTLLLVLHCSSATCRPPEKNKHTVGIDVTATRRPPK
jgi:hypothetical protein